MHVGERSESYPTTDPTTDESKKKVSSKRRSFLHSSVSEVLTPFRLGVSRSRRGRRRFSFRLPNSDSPFRQSFRPLRTRNLLDQSE